MGKHTDINKKANIRLKALFESKNITRCEICGSDNFLSFAHRKKRIEYRKHPELLSDFNEVILACVPCHQKIEYNKELTNQVFTRLRGDI